MGAMWFPHPSHQMRGDEKTRSRRCEKCWAIDWMSGDGGHSPALDVECVPAIGKKPELTVVQLPSNDIGDIPRGLRALADDIESGKHGDPCGLVWALDCRGGELKTGLLCATGEPRAVACFMHAMAQRKLEVG